MDLGLKDRVAFVAGASTGLGYASALQLLNEGCKVAICSRDAARIQAAARRLVSDTGVEPDRVRPLVCDVTREDQIDTAMAAITERFGGLNILVTNAGGPPSGQIGDFDASDWQKAVDLNLLSSVNLVRAALPYLKTAASEPYGLARILMITSISAKQPIPNLLLSNVTRAGVLGLAKTLSLELGPLGITVNALLPGYTRTDRLKALAASIQERTGQSEEESEQGWAAESALGRIGEPEEFAATLTFLASARASYITGVALPVDGGRSKHLL